MIHALVERNKFGSWRLPSHCEFARSLIFGWLLLAYTRRPGIFFGEIGLLVFKRCVYYWLGIRPVARERERDLSTWLKLPLAQPVSATGGLALSRSYRNR